MVRLEWSEALQRKTRRDDPAELGLSTWTLVRDAARGGRIEEALDLMDYQLAVDQRIMDRLTVGRDLLLTRLARF
ncbi:MAG: hypothetical protein Q7T04_06110, partial [Dehalococcoidia bacterium]|nr:hypothetical protein [Dehalococcoidia bacterium]